MAEATRTVAKTGYAVSSEDLIAGSALSFGPGQNELKKRGINVYEMSELWNVTGRDKRGERLEGYIERPLFGLTIQERVDLFRKCTPVFGIITARMNRIAGLEWEIVRKTKNEDKIATKLKMMKAIHGEYDDEVSPLHKMIRLRCVTEIRKVLPDCLPDLENFYPAMTRWSRRLRMGSEDRAEEIADWLNRPNVDDDFDDFIKKSVGDMMIHGSWAWYKETNNDNLLDNVYVLPGGSVIPMRGKFVGGASAYIQMIPVMDSKIYFQDEIIYASYTPSSSFGLGMVPLEALVNKLAEVLFFDQRAAMQADGTVPPEKLIVFGENSPFGDLTTGGIADDLRVPITKEEQARIETVVNEPRKGAMRVLTGTGGQPVVVDLSRSDIYQYMMQRQEKIREEVALVFNMSNMEINLTGSGDTSGRSTSESQERIEREKGIYPIVKKIENAINRAILPYRWGEAYSFEYKSGMSDAETLDLETKKVQSKTYSVNEVRVARGDEPFPEERYDSPDGAQPEPPDGSQQSPFNVQGGMDAGGF